MITYDSIVFEYNCSIGADLEDKRQEIRGKKTKKVWDSLIAWKKGRRRPSIFRFRLR